MPVPPRLRNTYIAIEKSIPPVSPRVRPNANGARVKMPIFAEFLLLFGFFWLLVRHLVEAGLPATGITARACVVAGDGAGHAQGGSGAAAA